MAGGKGVPSGPGVTELFGKSTSRCPHRCRYGL